MIIFMSALSGSNNRCLFVHFAILYQAVQQDIVQRFWAVV